MITLFILSLSAIGLLFAALTAVLFALMLETCSERAARATMAPVSLRVHCRPSSFDIDAASCFGVAE